MEQVVTPEAALEQLHKAIVDHAEAIGIKQGNELLNQFIVVAHWEAIEHDGTSRYTTQWHQNEVPTHIGVGLCRMGEHLITHGSSAG